LRRPRLPHPHTAEAGRRNEIENPQYLKAASHTGFGSWGFRRTCAVTRRFVCAIARAVSRSVFVHPVDYGELLLDLHQVRIGGNELGL
jgi:hypothetical protein